MNPQPEAPDTAAGGPRAVPKPPRMLAAKPADFGAVLQEALRRLCAEGAPLLPEWVEPPQHARRARKLQRWVRRHADLALADAGPSLNPALASSAQALLVEISDGWLLVDCREGMATLWAGTGDGVVHLSTLDPAAIRRILSLRPAQDVAPKVATASTQQPGLLPFLREYRGRLIELAFAGLVINFVAMMMPMFTMLVYDKVVGNSILETLWALAVGFSMFVALDLVLKAMRTHTVETVACRMDARTERRLLANLLDQRGPMPPVGLLLARYRDLVAAREFLSSNWLLAIADTPYVAAYLTFIAIVGGPVVWVPIGVGAVMVVVHWLLHRPATHYGELATAAQTQKITVLSEVLNAGEVVRSTHLRYALGRKFGQLAEKSSLAQARGRYWHHLGHHMTATAITLSAIGVVVVGVYRIEAREMTTGGLVACSMLASRTVSMLAGLTLLGSRWEELRNAMKKLGDLIADSDTERDRPLVDRSDAQWQSRGNSLALRAVHFEHEPKRPLIEDLSLDIAPGQFVVLIGKPGSGKSTLLKLLGGLLRPGRGDVMLDGHSIADWPAEVRARRLGIKPQEAILFEGTLAQNIVAGAESEVTADSFSQALAVSGLAQWIASGELSLSQRLLPGGVNISGGQRQVVALARSLAIGPPVLLLDEPTVGLDQATEQGIVNRLRAWSRGRTVVVATHSMAMVQAADRLIVLEGGRVIADGPRDKVLVAPPARAAGTAPQAAAQRPATMPPHAGAPAMQRPPAVAAMPPRHVPPRAPDAGVPQRDATPSSPATRPPAARVPAARGDAPLRDPLPALDEPGTRT